MTMDILQTASVQRLQGLLKHRYGKGLEVRFLVDATQWNSSGVTVSSGDLFIPIVQEGMFLGLAKVPSVHDLPSTSIEAITEVVRLILEPALYRRYLDGQPTMGEVDGESEQIHSEPANQEQSPKAVLLYSTNPQRIQKVAVNLHETTERWAMLRYSDMKRFGSVEEIQGLGRATIFVEDLLQLSPDELNVLSEFLKVSDTRIEPMILVGSTRTLHEINNSGDYPETLTTEFSRFSAELDRWPQDESMLRQALSMILNMGSAANSLSSIHRLDF